MQDIRFVSGDGNELILETTEGEKLRLTVDNEVREAIRKQPISGSANTLKPREIQDAIRSGSTIDELVSASGDSVEYVSSFAKPVLEELEHMVASALAVRVEIEPDRFNEVRHREFGELITERLRNGGASSIVWSASRETPTTWLVSARFETMGGVGVATWTFDPRHVHLTAENETAVGLSNSGGFGDSPIPKLQVIPTTSKPEVSVEPEPAPVTELLDAFKQRREAAAAEVVEVVEVEVVVPEEPKADEEEVNVAVSAVEEVPTETDAPRKGRAPMPSWDEIVFGSKSDD